MEKIEIFMVVGYRTSKQLEAWKKWFPIGSICKRRLNKFGFRAVNGPYVCEEEVIVEPVTEDMIPALKMIHPEIDWRYLGYA